MKIRNEGPRERILLMGAAGSGKSNAVLSIARCCPDQTVYVLDTEVDTYERLLYGTDIDNVEYQGVMPDDWEAMRDAVDLYLDKAGREDWVVVDSISPTWGAVQTWFADKVMGDNLADMLLTARQEMKKDASNLKVFEGWTDWQTINAQYAKFMNKLLRMNARGAHLLFTAEAESLRDDANKETRAMFGKLGVKPRGNKRLPHIPHDILFMKQNRNNWEYETVKSQGERKDVDGELSDFAKQYLLGNGGWQVYS